MKNIFTAFLFLSVAFGFGQKNAVPKGDAELIMQNTTDVNVEVDYSQIFTSVQVYASPPGGINAFRKYIASSFQLPKVNDSITDTIMGAVIAKFVVWDDGTIRDIVIVKENIGGLGLGKEVERILLNSPKWTPAQINGRNVKQYFTLPVTIQIEPAEKKVGQPIEEIKKEEASNVTEKSSEIIATSYEKQAEPIGGIKKFYMQLSSSIEVPEVEVSGTYKTKVKFVVNQDGSLSDYQVIEETPYNVGLGQNVIKYLKSIKNWIPSEQNGKKVKTYFVLPVTTIIENEPEPEPKKD